MQPSHQPDVVDSPEESGLEEGDDLGATDEEGVGAGAALVTEASASSTAAVSARAIVMKRSIKNWRKLELVGAGSFGTVYEAASEDGFAFAVKEASLIHLIGPESYAKQSAGQPEQEVLLLSQLEHKNNSAVFWCQNGDFSCQLINCLHYIANHLWKSLPH